MAIAFACEEKFFADPTPETDADLEGEQSFFVGEKSVSLYGEPLLLDDGLRHLSSAVTWEGRPVAMDPSLTVGTRTRPTPIDFAVIGTESAPPP